MAINSEPWEPGMWIPYVDRSKHTYITLYQTYLHIVYETQFVNQSYKYLNYKDHQ